MFVDRMPFGRYKGRLLSELPDSYLWWLLALPDLSSWLRRALESEADRRDVGAQSQEHQVGVIALADLRGVITTWFREMSRRWHPDHGGTHESGQAINAAHDRLRELLGLK